MARLISITYTYEDDEGRQFTVSNVDGKQAQSVVEMFGKETYVSLSKYNKQQNKKTAA